MDAQVMTEPELLVLGLVAEMPRHGYQLAREIDDRGMREWTPIGFSSIYFLLGKLEQKRLVRSKEPARAKAKRVYTITAAGRKALVAQTVAALANYRPTYSPVLLGMLHWPVLEKEQALAALCARGEAIATEATRLREIQFERQPLPDFVEALFDFSLGQLKAEEEWIARTLDYMKTKPWLQ
jgi:DNA-binding PadR family transcriptional regulator